MSPSQHRVAAGREVPHSPQRGFKASVQTQEVTISETQFRIYLYQREGKVMLEVWEEADVQGQKPEQGPEERGCCTSPHRKLSESFCPESPV